MNVSTEDNFNTSQRRFSIAGLALWVGVNYLGLTAIFFITSAVLAGPANEAVFASDLTERVVVAFLLGALLGGVAGLGIGWGQRSILLRVISSASSWPIATMIGWAIGGAAFLGLVQLLLIFYPDGVLYSWESPHPNFGVLLSIGALGGMPIATSICQWLVLRPTLRGSIWWGVATILGWAAGFALAWFALRLHFDVIFDNPVLSMGLISIPPGIITGLALNWLLARGKLSFSLATSTS